MFDSSYPHQKFMGYKDPEQQRRYQKEWVQRRRQTWLQAHGPCIDCGTWEDLEVDHVNPRTKVSHRVWSWSEQRRIEELKKCVPRCEKCHKLKTKKEVFVPTKHGSEYAYRIRKCRCIICRREKYRRIKDYRERLERDRGLRGRAPDF